MKEIRHSKQRDLVLRVVKKETKHPTAHDVYEMAKNEDPSISLGTVYRNLNLLADMGQILRIEVPGGADRFDGISELHSHAVCSSCGYVMDYNFNFDDLTSHLLSKAGFRCKDVSITVRGLCKNCCDGSR